MANISLEGSIRTCKVDTAWADRIAGDRIFNPNNMVCPPWNHRDTSGRPVSWDSFYTKTPGCNSSRDRVLVENALRPQYIEYVNLDASGIRGGQQCYDPRVNPDTDCHQKGLKGVHDVTGQFGLNTGYSQNIYPNCVKCANYSDILSPCKATQQAKAYAQRAKQTHHNRKHM